MASGPPRKRRRNGGHRVFGSGFVRDRDDSSCSFSDWSDTESSDGESIVPKGVTSLLDLAASVTAKHYACDQLEQQGFPLDEILLKKIAYWAFPQDEKQVQVFANLTTKSNEWDRGEEILEEKRVYDMWQVGFMATALVKSRTMYGVADECRVSMTFEKQRITSSSCSFCDSAIWCPHIIAAILNRIRYPDEIPVHAPLTETLSSLTRDQLQKLLQYAVNEEPSGVLAKVFKHMDNIRDLSSEANSLQGAPDPTFGTPKTEQSHWDLSLEKLEKNLKGELLDLTRQLLTDPFVSYSQTVYPDSCDLIDKAESHLHTYLQKAMDLVQQGETNAAGRVLIAIAESVFHVMELHPDWRCPSLSRFAHDLEKIYTEFIVHMRGEISQDLLAAAVTFNERARKLPRNIFTKDSMWAEAPSIKVLFKDSSEVRGDSSAAFYEPLCAACVPSPSTQYCNVLNNTENSANDYNESLPTMVIRLEALLSWGVVNVFQQISHLAITVLQKLFILSHKYSILSLGECPTVPGAKRHNRKSDCRSGKGPTGRKGSRGRRRTTCSLAANLSQNEAPQPSTSMDTSESTSENDEYTKEQLSYCLLYLCDMVFRTKQVLEMGAEKRCILAKCSLRALEMSRFRTVADRSSITFSEQSWLLRLERSIINHYLDTNWFTLYFPGMTSVCNNYMDAICSHGCAFYDGAYPLMLLDCLMKLTDTNKGQVLEMCSKVITDSDRPLQKFTLPTSSGLGLVLEDLEDDYFGSFSSRKHRDFAARKFHNIIETFLSRLTVQNELLSQLLPHQNELLSSVLQHLQNVDDYRLLRLTTKSLRTYMVKIKPSQIKSCMKVVMQCIKLSRSIPFSSTSNYMSDRLDKDFLINLGLKLGLDSLKLFVNNWQDFFYIGDLKKLLEGMKSHVEGKLTMPREVVQLIMQYFSSNDMHGEDSCDLLQFFTSGDANYNRAVKKIIKNSKSYIPSALLCLAKQEHERNVSVKGDVNFSSSIFEIIQCAFSSMDIRKLPISATDSLQPYLSWLFQHYVEAPPKDVAKSAQFATTIHMLETHCECHPEILLRFLQTVEKSPSLLKQSSSLTTKLVVAYQHHFLQRFDCCGHASYGSVINDMVKARLQCKQYAKNGDNQFDMLVIEKIKLAHSGKKKLLRMINDEFSKKKL